MTRILQTPMDRSRWPRKGLENRRAVHTSLVIIDTIIKMTESTDTRIVTSGGAISPLLTHTTFDEGSEGQPILRGP
jgi:hypothetical protein